MSACLLLECGSLRKHHRLLPAELNPGKKRESADWVAMRRTRSSSGAIGSRRTRMQCIDGSFLIRPFVFLSLEFPP